jgi:hypothetical protein
MEVVGVLSVMVMVMCKIETCRVFLITCSDRIYKGIKEDR